MKFIVISLIFYCLTIQVWTFCPQTIADTSLQSAISILDNCTYPTDKFNVDCVSSSCPQLKSSGLCPTLSNGNLNFTAIQQILAIASQSFQQKGTICSTPIHPIPIPPTSTSLQSIFSPLPLGGTIGTDSTNTSITNLSQTTFTLIPPQPGTNNLIVSIITPNYVYLGTVSVVLTLDNPPGNSTQLLKLEKSPVEMNCSINITSQIFLNTNPPTFKILSDVITPVFHASAFQVNYFDFSSLFSSLLQTAVQASDIPTATANFLTTYIATVLQAAATLNCPKPKGK